MAASASMRTAKKAKDLTIHYLIMVLISIFVFLPYYWMIITSLKPAEEVMLSPTLWFPTHLDFTNYVQIWGMLPLLKYMGNSIYVAVATTVVGLILSTIAGYSLSRYRTKIGKVSTVLFLFTQLIPGMLPFIAFYFLMFKLGLINSYTGLIIAYSIWSIPFCTLMMRGYFTSAIPLSIEESATIDGCSKWGTFFKIALPLSKPGLAATAIFSFITAWNEFMWASVMLTDSAKKPVAVGIYDFIGQWGDGANVSAMMTAAVLITIPAIVLFSFLQRYLVSGITSGAVKG